MYRVSDFTKQCYKVNEAAEILGVATKTIRNYDNRGILKAERTVGNHRMISRDSLIRFLDEKGMILDDTIKQRRDIVYARVSSHDQKTHGDLDKQALFLEEHVPDMQNPLILKEVGSGLNDKRKKLLQVLGRCPRSGGKTPVVQRIIYAAGTPEEEACRAVRGKLECLASLNDGDLTAGLPFDI